MVSAALYCPIFLAGIALITMLYALFMQKSNTSLLQKKSNNILVLGYILIFIVFIGMRPISGYYFGDTSNYALVYFFYSKNVLVPPTPDKEWVFNGLMYSCSQVMPVNGFFTIVASLYILPMLWACRRWVSQHATLMMIWCMGAFSFFTYGVNGIRNGMACSLVILALSFITGNRKEKLFAIIVGILAFYCHRSTLLPLGCMLIGMFVKNIRYALAFWVTSIAVSLVAGGTVESFFTSLGFDDRMSSYALNHGDDAMFSSTGFRFDFLLYSAMPIVLGYYVVIKKRIYDRTYSLLLTTYILSNAFWVMMIRASYSNRFAYLSWFLYAILLAYPCLKLPIWKNQGRTASYILLAHVSFTLFMNLLY